MKLNVSWGIYGIHGTNEPLSIETVSNHGCIRMLCDNVKELYSIAIGTSVFIY